MLSVRTILLVLLLGVVTPGWSENVQETKQKILDGILTKYDRRLRPVGVNNTKVSDNAPVLVSVNMYVRMINQIDDLKMEYNMQITLRQNWIDPRLKFDSPDVDTIQYLTLDDPSKIWLPDLFFSNENEAHVHNLMTPNVFIRIYPSGNVQYSTRISLTLSCPMNLRWFPFDSQVCTAKLASYGWSTDDLIFIWKEVDAVQIGKTLNIPRFDLSKYDTALCTSKTSTGEYSCLKLDLYLERELSYYLMTVFLPSAMLVIVSWISFWLDHDSITARSLVGVATLLALLYQTLVFNSTLAPVSYTRSIDVWTGICLTFLFTALLESAVVNYTARSEAKRRNRTGGKGTNVGEEEMDLKPLVVEGEACPTGEEQPVASGNNRQQVDTNFIRNWLNKTPTNSKRLDILSRVLFPIGFAAFVILYSITNWIHCATE